ncbi:hypothetical protein N6H18_14645 [Reichenbachiella agarivorans]|uniref:NERD domain-containing protein n=1 Tax=Reichenbachiella agarivorans TaxID=2979464 RepID=A0ABY6CQF7_9BACT|nr:hypothetical protein [Reichenbachiella agarivorans]UXP31588.1 hypothetical protein N6H18_14645 [Reichenbachiella agarivorans]
MSIPAPKAQLILDYKFYFGVKPPNNRISLISHISKQSILYEIAALNYRLKPKNKISIDTSFETQVKELKYFTKTKAMFNKYSSIAEDLTKDKENYPIIFNRQGCLFAIEEIVNSTEMKEIDGFIMAKIEVWESIVKYFLAVNYAITRIKREKDDNNSNFESLNPKLLPLNELSIETDQIFTSYRGYWLIDYFLNQPDFSSELKGYFQETYGIEPQHFIFHLMSMYLANSNEKPEFNFFYQIQDGQENFFDKLSKRVDNQETHKLISIRKSPFIKVGDKKYLISDNTFLIEKAYSQLLNDFWFDWIKPIKDEKGKNKFNIQKYRSEFGYFFENYLSKIFRKSFENYKYSTLLMFDQLKINTVKGNLEIADIYLRYGNKIMLGQVKSGSIYDTQKFGGNVEHLYRNDRNAFFENFGVNQVIESIATMNTHIQKLDPKFRKGHSYEIYPCIIVNDKSFQTPLMPDTFNTRFQELITDFSIKKIRVNPLTVIHISDLERLEDLIRKNPKEIWQLLKYNHRDKRFAPPFYDTINRKNLDTQYPTKILELFKSLILKYNPNDTENAGE